MITKRTGRYSETDTRDSFIYEIADEDGIAADLYIDTDSHLIMNIEVRADRQGEGLARSLYEHAKQDLGDIYHIPAWGCTEDGIGFAHAMGGDIMDDDQAAAIVGMDLSIYDMD
jgi:GNAT superfamily N-acetyltransferase